MTKDVSVNLEELTKSITAAVQNGSRAALEELGVGHVDRSRVAVLPDGERGAGDPAKPAYGTAARLSAPWNSRYRGLPEWEQEIRNEDVDHHIQEWALGMLRGDHARMARAHDAIAKMPQWEREQRDLNTTDDSALIPAPMAAIVVELKRKIQVIGPRAQPFRSSSGTLKVPTETTFAAAAGVLEAGTITPSDPTTGSVDLTKVKAVVATRSSYEFIDDNAFNATSFLSRQAARTLALRNDAQDIADGDGTGTNQTDAIMNNSSISVVDAAVGVMVFGDVSAIWFALMSQYRSNAVWMCRNEIVKELSDIVDGNSRPIFLAGDATGGVLSGGQGAPGVGTVFGRPVLEVTGATAGVLVLGDLEFYGVLEHPSIRAEVSKDEAFLTDEITWKWVQRRDGAVLQPEAFKKSTVITEG